MAEHNELGRIGEMQACIPLVQENYILLARNWRSGHLEIDIVAESYGEIVFVEVKTRSHNEFDQARQAVTLNKKRNLIAAAHAYLRENNRVGDPYRLDIITVVGTKRPFEIKHYVYAYSERGVNATLRHEKREFEV